MHRNSHVHVPWSDLYKVLRKMWNTIFYIQWEKRAPPIWCHSFLSPLKPVVGRHNNDCVICPCACTCMDTWRSECLKSSLRKFYVTNRQLNNIKPTPSRMLPHIQKHDHINWHILRIRSSTTLGLSIALRRYAWCFTLNIIFGGQFLPDTWLHQFGVRSMSSCYCKPQMVVIY